MQKYRVTEPDPGNALFAGQVVEPSFEDSNEIIIHSSMPGVSHHVKKGGLYFAKHFEPIGGSNR